MVDAIGLVTVVMPESTDVTVSTLYIIRQQIDAQPHVARLSYFVLVCVNVKVATGMRRNEEQKALAGFCCLSAVTSLVTTGHRAGVVAAGTGFAPVRANKAARTSESIMGAKQSK